jgi:hypothetical protein
MLPIENRAKLINSLRIISPINVILDGLDENKYFFALDQNDKPKIEALQKFIDSALGESLQSLAVGGALYFFYSFPKISNLHLPPIKTKIPTISIEWKFSDLANYANFQLQLMHASRKNACAKLPEFEEMIPYKSNPEILELLKKHLVGPRSLHKFMRKLISQWSIDNKFVKPFNTTLEDIKQIMEIFEK